MPEKVCCFYFLFLMALGCLWQLFSFFSSLIANAQIMLSIGLWGYWLYILIFSFGPGRNKVLACKTARMEGHWFLGGKPKTHLFNKRAVQTLIQTKFDCIQLGGNTIKLPWSNYAPNWIPKTWSNEVEVTKAFKSAFQCTCYPWILDWPTKAIWHFPRRWSYEFLWLQKSCRIVRTIRWEEW